MVAQKMAELEKQNLESRILILGAHKPNSFFNTHQRVYEKVTLPDKSPAFQGKVEVPTPMSGFSKKATFNSVSTIEATDT